MGADRRNPIQPDRRTLRGGGRRAVDKPAANGWTTGQLGWWIGHGSDFVLGEIKDGRIVASKFGREWRIAYAEVCRYCVSKNYPEPDEHRSL
jgi:hypothetical protein